MSDNLQTESAPSIATLVGGIINDAQQLIRQEIALARREAQGELNKAKAAAISFGTGIMVAVPGALMLCFFLVTLIHWLASPPNSDPATIPLWGCYLIVGVLFLIVSGLLFVVAKNRVSDINLVPPQTAESIKENVQWIKNQT